MKKVLILFLLVVVTGCNDNNYIYVKEDSFTKNEMTLTIKDQYVTNYEHKITYSKDIVSEEDFNFLFSNYESLYSRYSNISVKSQETDSEFIVYVVTDLLSVDIETFNGVAQDYGQLTIYGIKLSEFESALETLGYKKK